MLKFLQDTSFGGHNFRVGCITFVSQEAAEGADNVKEEAGEPGLAFDADSIKVMVEPASKYITSKYMHMTLHKVMAETIGMGLLPEEAARELAEEATYRHHFHIWPFSPSTDVIRSGFGSWCRTARSSCTMGRGTGWLPRTWTRLSG